MSFKTLLAVAALLAAAACKTPGPTAICEFDDETGQTVCTQDNGPQDAGAQPASVPDVGTPE